MKTQDLPIGPKPSLSAGKNRRREEKLPSQKALKACADYALLSIEIKRLSDEIGRRIGDCMEAGGSGSPDVETHLADAYRPETVEVGYCEPGLRYMNDAAVRRYLAVCPHCLAAHEAIQQRKAARKSLGAVKRAITMIGRRAAKGSV